MHIFRLEVFPVVGMYGNGLLPDQFLFTGYDAKPLAACRGCSSSKNPSGIGDIAAQVGHAV